MRTMVMLAIMAAAMLVAIPAEADHKTLIAENDATVQSPREGTTTDGSLDIDLKLGLKGFRFGSRVFGKDGYSGGAWLNGETRSGGFTLDGRLEREGRAHNFKMNVDVDEWLRRATRWWLPTTDL